jgi:hypothetical protein
VKNEDPRPCYDADARIGGLSTAAAGTETNSPAGTIAAALAAPATRAPAATRADTKLTAAKSPFPPRGQVEMYLTAKIK